MMFSPWRLCSKMINSPVRSRWCVLHGDCGQDDSLSFGTGWFTLLWTGLISSPVEASYPCGLGLMGSTSHLINEQVNEDRDHSSTDGRIVVSTVLPMLGWPSLIWDQWYWFGTSGRSCTHYDTDFGSVEDWSGTSGTHSEIDFESVWYILDHFFFFIIRTKQSRTEQIRTR